MVNRDTQAFQVPREHGLYDLMPHRVHEVLLVSSAYDAFILSEDGQLSERLSSGFAALSLSAPPRITQVETAKKALRALAWRRFDMVLLGVGLRDSNVSDFARALKARHPGLPIVLLTFGEADIQHCPGGIDHNAIDRVFLWTGDAQILVAIIKIIEDAANAEHDSDAAGVQVILVVEDSVQRYSSFLALLYAELLQQSQSMSAEGLNELHRFMRMRSRPKILLATSWEEATALAAIHHDQLMALITDVDFPRGGVIQSAGFDLVDRLRRSNPGLPVLLQSADAGHEPRADELEVRWAHKTSAKLMATLRAFLRLELGFGEFEFKLPNGTVLARAVDLKELERLLDEVPEESVRYHAEANHFSTWLNARGMFRLAKRLQPRKVEEFDGVGELRAYLIRLLHEARKADQRGRIADFSAYTEGSEFVRLGGGSLGGKGRGVAFLHALIEHHELGERFAGLEICVPRTAIIGTGEFEKFLVRSEPPPPLLEHGSDEEILRWFVQQPLPDELIADLGRNLEAFDGPIAVRSSSLLEDSRFQPFAGVYATWMLPNIDPSPTVRLEQLCRAIKAVWASTYFEGSRAYFRGLPQTVEEERMGIVLQQAVGRRCGDRFYPHMAGVAQSRNYYPLKGQAAEDGVAMIAAGFGHEVVGGGRVFRFSPAQPASTPPYLTVRDFVANSQSRVRVLDLSAPLDFHAGCESNLVWVDLATAEADGMLKASASVYDPHDDVIRDDINRPGPRVVTFNNVLKWEAFPLAPALADTLRMLRRAMAGEVEIEFAVDTGDWGRIGHVKNRRPPQLILLQARHMASQYHGESAVDLDEVAAERIFCRSDQALGDGLVQGVRDVVHIGAKDLHAKTTPGVALEVSAINARLRGDKIPYVLIGPGRWGTSDPGLGIPVQWADIAGARVIIETPFGTRSVAPSQGTHFFHNITSLGIGYLTIREFGTDLLDVDWLTSQPVVEAGNWVTHYRLEEPLEVHLQGRDGRAALLRPERDREADILRSWHG